MAERKPVVLVGGQLQELPAGDALPPQAPGAHTHAQSDITGLVTALAGKAANNVTLTDAAGTATLPATSSATVASRLQVLRNNVKQAFADLGNKLNTDFAGLTARTIDGTETLALSGGLKATVQAVLNWVLGRANTWTGTQTFNGSVKVTGNKETTYALESAERTSSVAAGGVILNVPTFSGMVLINNLISGGVYLFLVGGGGVYYIAGASDSHVIGEHIPGIDGYRFTNITGTAAFSVMTFRTRARA